MVTIDIKENIRFFKPNDPYYYEVDNLPLIDLLNNDKILRDEINLILAADTNYASEAYVQTNIQAAIGSAAEVDIDGDGITPAFTDLISWINAQGYLTEVATSIGDLLDVDTTSNVPGAGDALIYDGTLTKWVPGPGTQEIVYFDTPFYFMNTMKYGVDSATGELLGRPEGLGIDASPTPLQGDKYNLLGDFEFGASRDLFEGNQGRIGVYRMYNIMNTSDFNGVNLTQQTEFKFRRTFAECGLPANTTSIFMAAFVSDAAKQTSADRSSRIIFRNLPAVTNSYGTGYPGNCIVHCYSDGDSSNVMQANSFLPVLEYKLGENQILNQTIEFEMHTTSLATQQVHASLTSRPGMSIVISGYKVG